MTQSLKDCLISNLWRHIDLALASISFNTGIDIIDTWIDTPTTIGPEPMVVAVSFLLVLLERQKLVSIIDLDPI